MYKELRDLVEQDADEVDVVAAQAAYNDEKRKVISLTRRENQMSWHKKLLRVHAQMLHRPRDFWKFTSNTANWRRKGGPAGITPIYGDDGKTLLTQLSDIVSQWSKHYRTLASDVTGHSRDMEYWSHMDPEETRKDHLVALDESFSREEVWAALKKMKRYKAPGHDGITTDFFKASLLEKERLERFEENEAERGQAEGESPREPPKCPMTDCLVNLINLAYENAEIPPQWEDSVVVSLPKDGDLADPGNYRGISLMSTTLKVITVMLSERINREFERNDLFCTAQAGFRKLEEAITQAACVVDILTRRRVKDETTYATFIDLKKAYDTVPHGALFAKLHQSGVGGRCLDFIKALYSHSRITVRVGAGKLAQMSESFPLHRGVRQG